VLTQTMLRSQRHRPRPISPCSRGVSAKDIIVVRHPVTACPRFPSPSAENRRVLWASRLDREKRPRLLAEIARRLPDWSFDVYGSNVLDDGGELERLRTIPNIHYQGPFASFDDIPASAYHCFLYTSGSDGMPNVVLEAMRAGLLVVAPDVGGISEVIDDRTGVLIRDVDGPSAYVDALRDIHLNPERYPPLIEAGKTRIVCDFSLDGFRCTLRDVPGYIVGAVRAHLLNEPLDTVPGSAPMP